MNPSRRLQNTSNVTEIPASRRIENTTETLSTVEQERRTTKHILNLEHGGDFVDVSACIGRARELLDGFTSQRSNAGVKRIKLLVAYRRREIPPSELRTGSDSTEPIAAARTHGDIVGDGELIAESRVENGSRGERSKIGRRLAIQRAKAEKMKNKSAPTTEIDTSLVALDKRSYIKTMRTRSSSEVKRCISLPENVDSPRRESFQGELEPRAQAEKYDKMIISALVREAQRENLAGEQDKDEFHPG
ncbi:hypothetical protein C8R45DRAFT_944331 [Mycena sanguinolenta]|nr:hypothetical protein C8R45DRAFT_944331 [Mycena sanguinolenta]